MVYGIPRQDQKEDYAWAGDNDPGPKAQNVLISGVERLQDRLQAVCSTLLCSFCCYTLQRAFKIANEMCNVLKKVPNSIFLSNYFIVSWSDNLTNVTSWTNMYIWNRDCISAVIRTIGRKWTTRPCKGIKSSACQG